MKYKILWSIIMKLNLIVLIALLSSSLSFANSNISGLWKNVHGVLYSIHQEGSSIVVGVLATPGPIARPGVQGEIKYTNNQYDLAINGSGFFILESSNGEYLYTRNGHFVMDNNNNLVDNNGNKLVTRNSFSGFLPEPENNPDYMYGKETCHEIFGCTQNLIDFNKIDIFINMDGVFINNKYKEIDRIILASIPTEQIKFDKYPIKAINADISYSYASDTAPIIHNALEELVVKAQTWKGYTGEFHNNVAIISPTDPENSHQSRTITFNSDTSATLSYNCPENVPQPFCDVTNDNSKSRGIDLTNDNSKNRGNDLIKVY